MSDQQSFARLFAQAFGTQDAAGLAALFSEDGNLHSLTGRHLEGRRAIEAGLAEEFAGLSRMARLVTGRTGQQSLGSDVVILHKRYVVTGLRDANGAEMPRVGALLTVVLANEGEVWLAKTATFAVVDG
ncbi:SgcJ/EcaC family oxidoreductase [Thioclava sp. FR2]|uniref:SgcJ/EcaC family oxidoreductase n=1 Tax=Thioclava sp. FR2 TaxID=3445780 RepID=UPI003EBD9175